MFFLFLFLLLIYNNSSSNFTTTTNTLGNCVVFGCDNRNSSSLEEGAKGLTRHVKTRSHIEALLFGGLLSSKSESQQQPQSLFCMCGSNEAKLISIDLVQCLGAQRHEGILVFFFLKFFFFFLT